MLPIITNSARFDRPNFLFLFGLRKALARGCLVELVRAADQVIALTRIAINHLRSLHSARLRDIHLMLVTLLVDR